MKTRLLLICTCLFLSMSLSAQQREAHSFAVKNPSNTFIGGVFDPKSLNTDTHQFVNITVPESIDITVLRQFKTIIPTYENMMKAVRESVIASGKIDQQKSFSYRIKKIKSYDELEWYFGQTINLETFFGIPQGSNLSKNTVAVDITQEFFSVEMDFPHDGKLHDQDPEIVKREDELVYVSSLTFGRKAILLISSSSDYKDINAAIQESLTNNPKTLSVKSRAILSNADIRIMVIGNPSLPIPSSDTPFASVMEYFNRSVTIEDFGQPIKFTGTWIKTNGMFVNNY